MMGEIGVKVKLQNKDDLALYKAGVIKKSQLRKETIDALVDTGAVDLVLNPRKKITPNPESPYLSHLKMK